MSRLPIREVHNRTPELARSVKLLAYGVGAAGACTVGLAGLLTLSNDTTYERLIMPATRRLFDAEKAHRLAVRVASLGFVPSSSDSKEDTEVMACKVFGRLFVNPIGLAAGFDKHAEAMPGLFKIGFGFVEIGSVTPEPQQGNPRPRVFRLPEDQAVINRYGFNSCGHAAVKERLVLWTKIKAHHSKMMNVPMCDMPQILGVNLGVNKSSDNRIHDYVKGIEELGPYADYIVVNISSPNTPGLRSLQRKQHLIEIIDKVLEERDRLPHCPPVLAKIAPDLSDEEMDDIAAVALRPKSVDGLIISNTTIQRMPTLKSSNQKEAGGLSGAPLKELSTRAINKMYRLTKGSVPIVGVGGVSSGQDAFEKICAGASLIQLYTALTYDGPTVVGRVKRELVQILKEKGYQSVVEAVGSGHKNEEWWQVTGKHYINKK